MVKLTSFRKQRISDLLIGADLEPDTIDIDALWDSSLSYNENITNITNQLQIVLMSKAEREKGLKQEMAHKEEEARRDYEQQITIAENESLEKLKQIPSSDINAYYTVVDELINVVITKNANSLLLLGEGGLGKTYRVMKQLGKHGLASGQDYVYANSYSTPLEFYNFLFEHKDKLIVLDDLEGILSDERGQSILKSALWSATPERILTYYTTSDKIKAPNKFVFEGRIILCMNDVGTRTIGMQALLSRMLYYNLDFSFHDKLRILCEIAKQANFVELNLDERMTVFEHVQKTTTSAHDNLNIRTLIKAFGLYRYCKGTNKDWKALIDGINEVNENKLMFLRIIEKDLTVNEQIKEFVETTGLSRATFFNYKHQLCKKSKSLTHTEILDLDLKK